MTAPAIVMPATFSVTLPLPPSTNNAYRNAPGLGRVLTAEAKEWKKSAGWLLHLDYKAQGSPPLTPPLSLSLFLYFARDGRNDLDNRIKLCQDVLCTMLRLDDRHVHEVHAYRAISKDNPRLDLVVRSLAELLARG